ncbi:hypothetical protein N658DRAFT_271374 [Parathielavia hyrcaniae]|uniref:Uncharacterized protein n=1 Tax=Parathielavia hyrcaniae TaxID=113614 RepID=A0AAN6Q5Q7_9PEZI|nr:hypothetical protein N658DRAFT_271374 [Parathielavia hyrcaniae]
MQSRLVFPLENTPSAPPALRPRRGWAAWALIVQSWEFHHRPCPDRPDSPPPDPKPNFSCPGRIRVTPACVSRASGLYLPYPHSKPSPSAGALHHCTFHSDSETILNPLYDRTVATRPAASAMIFHRETTATLPPAPPLAPAACSAMGNFQIRHQSVRLDARHSYRFCSVS